MGVRETAYLYQYRFWHPSWVGIGRHEEGLLLVNFLNAPWRVPLEDLAGIIRVRGVVTSLRVTGR